MGYRAYLFDLDGTLYRGEQPMLHAAETLAGLRSRGAHLRFLTNNSGITPEQVTAKLVRLGMECGPNEAVTSGMAAARRLIETSMRIFAIGEPGLVEVLRQNGLTVLNAGEDGRVRPDEGPPADAVCCGICRFFDYALLNAGLQALLAGADFIATNPDPTYPKENGRLEPGAGSLVAALAAAAGVQPYVAGKPRPDMVRMALESCGIAPEEALVVGDRPDTDLAAAEAAGCPSVLVLTGVAQEPPQGVRALRDLRELLEENF
jgi:4-nitrophenyl phosphatase